MEVTQKMLSAPAITGHARAASPEIDADAMYARGMALLIAGDRAAAIDWLRLAAQFNHAPAQFDLGLQYASGKDRDHRTAFKWIRRAAGLGHARAQYWLARCYFLGVGTAQSHGLAYRWSVAACAQGFPDTGQIRSAAAAFLSEAERRRYDAAVIVFSRD